MNPGKWWRNKKVNLCLATLHIHVVNTELPKEKLPEGVIVMPVIVGSDGTQLSDFSGNHNSWPLYATISNISREICGKSSYNTLQVK
jgi:hypothetical protein